MANETRFCGERYQQDARGARTAARSNASRGTKPDERLWEPLIHAIEISCSVSTRAESADSLTNFSVGLATTLVGNLQLKVEFIDSYKNRPANPTLKKNDTAFLTTFVLKF